VSSEAAKKRRELKRKVSELERTIVLRAGARPATPLICAFIDACRDRFGVVPICRALSS